jgi:hypothetical protein
MVIDLLMTYSPVYYIVVDLNDEDVWMNQNEEIHFENENDVQLEMNLLLMIQVQTVHVEKMVEHLMLIMALLT